MGEKYEFKAESMETLKNTMGGTSLIRNMIEGGGIDSYEKGILCLGQLKTLFGEPLYITEDLEDQYSYCISATDESGKKIYLHAYSGPSGPAIGGNHDEDSRQAADELAKLITGAEVMAPVPLKWVLKTESPMRKKENCQKKNLLRSVRNYMAWESRIRL